MEDSYGKYIGILNRVYEKLTPIYEKYMGSAFALDSKLANKIANKIFNGETTITKEMTRIKNEFKEGLKSIENTPSSNVC